MFAGDKDYFVAQVDCDVVINATLNGKKLAVPLLSQSKVDDEINLNPMKANREYYNKFDDNECENALVTRSKLIKNSEIRIPTLDNSANQERHYIFGIDTARSYDNSIIVVCECKHDENIGWYMTIENIINMREKKAGKKNGEPLKIPEQIQMIRNTLVAYNGEATDYENIKKLLIDTGAGGGGNSFLDFLLNEWYDGKGVRHEGIIDHERDEEDNFKFPNAVPIADGVVPQKWRNVIFDYLAEFLSQDLIKFTTYENKPYLNVPFETGKMVTEINDMGEKVRVPEVKYETKTLNVDEENALNQIELLKEEMLAFRRYDNGANHKYEVAYEKRNKVHDDRVYSLALCCKHLQELRSKDVKSSGKPANDIMDYCFFD